MSSEREYIVGMSAAAIDNTKRAIRCHGRSRNGGPRSVTSRSPIDNQPVTFWIQNDVLMSSHPTKGVRRVEAIDEMIHNREMKVTSAKGMLIDCLVRMWGVPVPIAMAMGTGPALPICETLDSKRESGELSWEEFKEELAHLTVASLEAIAEAGMKN